MERIRKQWSVLTDTQKQEISRKLVDKEVFFCATSVIDYVLKNSSEDRSAPFSYDDIENMYVYYDDIKDEEYTYEQLQKLKNEAEENGDDTLIEHYEEVGDESQPQEIFEWWYISTWLLEKLLEKGHPGIKHENLWGRCTSGQAILIDGDIMTLSKNLWEEGYYFDDDVFHDSFFVEGDA